MTKLNLFLHGFCGIPLHTMYDLFEFCFFTVQIFLLKSKIISLQGLQDVKSSLTGADVSGWKFHGSEYGNFNTGRRPSMNQGSIDSVT